MKCATVSKNFIEINAAYYRLSVKTTS
jgi:hypothetical protein